MPRTPHKCVGCNRDLTKTNELRCPQCQRIAALEARQADLERQVAESMELRKEVVENYDKEVAGLRAALEKIYELSGNQTVSVESRLGGMATLAQQAIIPKPAAPGGGG